MTINIRTNIRILLRQRVNRSNHADIALMVREVEMVHWLLVAERYIAAVEEYTVRYQAEVFIDDVAAIVRTVCTVYQGILIVAKLRTVFVYKRISDAGPHRTIQTSKTVPQAGLPG